MSTFPAGNGQAVIEACQRSGVPSAFLALSVSDAASDVIAVIRAGSARICDEGDHR